MAVSRDMERLTDFQISCEERLRDMLSRYDRSMKRKAKKGKCETYVEVQIQGTDLGVWIYVDEAMFGGNGIDERFEAPDYDTPAELIDAFVAKLTEHLEEIARGSSGNS